MNGCDRADQSVQYYGLHKRKSYKWKKIFHFLLEVTVMNSNILFHLARKEDNPAAKKWAPADFKDSLIAELCNAAATAQAVPRQIPQDINVLSHLSPATHIMESEKKDRNCRVCSRPEKRKLTTNVCATCPGRPYQCKKPCFKFANWICFDVCKLEVNGAIGYKIRSFKGRQSHYSLKDSKKLYLPEDLNVNKMHAMYLAAHPGETCCRESYRRIFVEKFNVSFGYPRKDTCSTCDGFKVELTKEHTEDELRRLSAERELHLRKGQVFYERKTAALLKAQTSTDFAAVAFDFWKNLPTPNISTNDVYYKRQLSAFTFNIHNLGTDEVHLFTYDETVGKKGSNEVASMLLHFCTELLSPDIQKLELFCDSCPGQNKNWTILRFCHFLVHIKKRFSYVKLSFPIRGHSYMECDRDMAVINQKLPVNTPSEWQQHFTTARQNPSPFNVIPVDQTLLMNVDKHIGNFFVAVCPVKTQPLREVIFSADHPRLMQYREGWNGPLSSAVLTKPVGKRRTLQVPLQPVNRTALPISAAKYKDLQDLKRFCPQYAQEFFANMPHHGQTATAEADVSDIDDEEVDES
ncbi:hypothetical protein EGW08_005340 [Elysia chlorotica]|uniref:DUF7869 domain-containing protein n=1 Tax=Elysia chlorotica TaxID=188477 RepID=A0A3S1BM65_ELYCH|nr:hypothetical protein EGW08_005340 [Elysia chlorotica]